MKRIYVQKRMFFFMNFFVILFALLGVLGGLRDKSLFNLLWVSLGLFTLSLFMLINRVFYDEKIVRFNFIYRKATISYEDIKEIFIEYDLIKGYSVICNLETEINCNCRNYLEYAKKCKELNIKNTFYFSGITEKDLERFLSNYHGKIKNYI